MIKPDATVRSVPGCGSSASVRNYWFDADEDFAHDPALHFSKPRPWTQSHRGPAGTPGRAAET